MKKTLILSVGLLLTGGLQAQAPEAESPVFHLDGFNPETVSAFKTASKEASDSLIPWTQPDTVVCTKAAGPYGMYVYTVDGRGNTVSQEALTYMAPDNWVTSQKILSSYNQWDLVDTTTMYVYYQRDGILIPSARKISTYDKRGRAVTLLNLEWNTQAEVWAKTSRYTYTYNQDNRLISTLQEEPDPYFSGEAWKNVYKTDYGYDGQGREIRFEMYIWTGTEWFPFRGIYRTYENDRLAVEHGSIFNDVTGVYGPTYRYNYFYNGGGKLTDYLVFYPDSTGKWGDTTLHEAHFYNAQGQETEQVTRRLDNAVGKLDNAVREFYFYDGKGRKDSVVHEVWESTDWWHTISMRYFFNENDICNGRIYYNLTPEYYSTDKYEMEFNGYGDGTRSRCFTLQNGEWAAAERRDLEVDDRNGGEILRANFVPLHEITVHYASGTKTPPPPPDTTSDDTTAIERINLLLDAQVEVYPNPVSETLYVDISGEGVYGVRLSNLSGAVVEEFRMEAGCKALNVSGRKGVHLLRVWKDGAATLRKIIIL